MTINVATYVRISIFQNLRGFNMALSKYKIFILSIFPILGLWILWEVFERPERVYKNWKTEWLPKRFGNTGKFLARVFWFFTGSLMTLLGLFFWYAVLTHKI